MNEKNTNSINFCNIWFEITVIFPNQKTRKRISGDHTPPGTKFKMLSVLQGVILTQFVISKYPNILLLPIDAYHEEIL